MPGKDIAIALLVVLIWSLNLIVQKIAVSHISVFVLSFLRVALVFPLLFFFPKPNKSLWKYFICSMFLITIYLNLFGYGLKSNIGAGLSAFFLQTQVLFIILCCFVLLGEKPKWFQSVGLIISFGGVYLLNSASSSLEAPFVSVGFLLICCLSFGIGIALSKKYEIGGNMTDITWLSMAAVIPLFLSCLIFEGPMQTFKGMIYISPIAISCVLFGALLSTIWATYLWMTLLQRTPASNVAPFMLLLPIFSSLIAYFVMGENLTIQQLCAGAVIIFGIMFTQKSYKLIPPFIYWLKNRVAS